MSKFIEEFYYGNIDPQARSTKKNKTVQKEMTVLTKIEELLTDSLGSVSIVGVTRNNKSKNAI